MQRERLANAPNALLDKAKMKHNSTKKAIILTALPVEYASVRSHLINPQEESHPQGTIYERGKFQAPNQEWEVLIVEIGQGNPKAAIEAERAIQYFVPDVIFFVGVAGGIKDVKLGDVIAATKIYEYESGKDEKTFKPRASIRSSTYRLEQRARAEAKKGNWLHRIKKSSSYISPRAFVGPIAAGSKVVASKKSSTYNFIRTSYSDALAVEMEGYGFLEAAHANPGVEALVVRGVSDLINSKDKVDTSGFQEIAANNASAFTFEVLARFTRVEATLPEERGNHRELHFSADLRIDRLLHPVGIGDWNAARDVALEILKATDKSGQNELFESLLGYLVHPDNEDMRWSAIITIESCVELAPSLLDRELLYIMATHKDFSIRSSAASICKTFADFAPDLVPIDILLKLAIPDEDWYVCTPAYSALKSMASGRQAVLRIFFNQLQSVNPNIRELAARAIADIARTEPEILDVKELEKEYSRLMKIADQTAGRFISEAIPKIQHTKRKRIYKYGL